MGLNQSYECKTCERNLRSLLNKDDETPVRVLSKQDYQLLMEQLERTNDLESIFNLRATSRTAERAFDEKYGSVRSFLEKKIGASPEVYSVFTKPAIFNRKLQEFVNRVFPEESFNLIQKYSIASVTDVTGLFNTYLYKIEVEGEEPKVRWADAHQRLITLVVNAPILREIFSDELAVLEVEASENGYPEGSIPLTYLSKLVARLREEDTNEVVNVRQSLENGPITLDAALFIIQSNRIKDLKAEWAARSGR